VSWPRSWAIVFAVRAIRLDSAISPVWLVKPGQSWIVPGLQRVAIFAEAEASTSFASTRWFSRRRPIDGFGVGIGLVFFRLACPALDAVYKN